MTPQIDAFLEMMQAQRGASANTLSAYRRDMYLLDEYLLSRHSDLLKASEDDLKSFLKFLMNTGDSVRTRARRLSCIHEFYRFAYSEGWIKLNPSDYLQSPKLPQSLPKYLTEDEIEPYRSGILLPWMYLLDAATVASFVIYSLPSIILPLASFLYAQ